MEKIKNNWPWLLLLILCLPAIWHLLYPGYFSVHDDMHPAWVFEMSRAFASGQLPPRWAPDLSYGFGYPLFHFIYPLPYYLGALFYGLGTDLVMAVKLVHVLAVLGSATGMYALAKKHWGVGPGLLAALLYVYTPYRAVNIYVRGAIGEHLAWVFMPLVFLSIDLLVEKLTWKRASFAGFAIAGLLLTHNIAAVATLPFAAVYGLVKVFRAGKATGKSIRNLLVGGVVGLGASAYFWLPALVDKPLMVEDTIFNFRDHFPFWKQLLIPSWGYGASLWGPDDGFSFQIGIVNILVVGLSGLLVADMWRRKKLNDSLAVLCLLCFGISLYLLNIRSSWIWDSVPLMNYFQFPWRLLLLTTFFSSVLAGFVFSELEKVKIWKQFQKVGYGVFVILVLVFSISYFQPDKHIAVSNEQILNKYLPVDPVNPQPPVSKDYQLIQEEYLRLPRATEMRPDDFPFERVQVVNPEAKVTWEQMSPVEFQIEKRGAETNLDVMVYQFPGWQVWLDGQPLQSISGEPYGQLRVTVPSGEHELRVQFIESGWRAWVSIGSAVIIIMCIVSIFLSDEQKILISQK